MPTITISSATYAELQGVFCTAPPPPPPPPPSGPYKPEDFPERTLAQSAFFQWTQQQMADLANSCHGDPSALTYLAGVSNMFSGAIMQKMGGQAAAQMFAKYQGTTSPIQAQVASTLGGVVLLVPPSTWGYPPPKA